MLFLGFLNVGRARRKPCIRFLKCGLGEIGLRARESEIWRENRREHETDGVVRYNFGSLRFYIWLNKLSFANCGLATRCVLVYLDGSFVKIAEIMEIHEIVYYICFVYPDKIIYMK